MRRWVLIPVGAIAALVLTANAAILLGSGGEPPRHAEAALVLGAQVTPNGRLSTMLEDRVHVAADLYRAGRVEKVLLSGDHGRIGYDEVGAMRRRILELGVPAQDVFTDHAGFDTWSSAVRARKVFGVTDALVVTQGFHLARAVWLARRAGLHAWGVEAGRAGGYGGKGTQAGAREVVARVKGFAEGILKPRPRFLGPLISIRGDGRRSWG